MSSLTGDASPGVVGGIVVVMVGTETWRPGNSSSFQVLEFIRVRPKLA